MSDESVVDNFQNKYEAFYSMGNALFKTKQHRRAIWYLSQAIENDKKKTRPLVERANCYLQLSQFDKALEDIATANALDKNNPKVLLLQGEINYQKGDFEKALTIFQRGKRKRSTMPEFQLGINKCELCINNASSADNPKKIILNDAMDLEEYYEEAYPEIKELKLAKIRQKSQIQKKKISSDKEKVDDLPPKIPPIPFNSKTMKQLMESEAVDRMFFNDIYEIEIDRLALINSAKSVTGPLKTQKTSYSKAIQRDTVEAAVYLDNRTNFWYRQNPKIVTDINKKTINPTNRSNNEALIELLPPIKCYQPLINQQN